MTHTQVNQIRIPQSYRNIARLLLRVCFLALLGLLCCYDLDAIGRPASDGPEVVIGPTKRDFGEVFAGEELEQNFPVRNNGTKPLELSQRSALGSTQTLGNTEILGSTQGLLNTQTWPRFQLATADWHSGNQPITRTVSSRLAAPS